MTPFAQNFTVIISIGAVLAQALTLGLIGALVFKKDWTIRTFAEKHGVLIAFATALSGMIFSLIYSEVIGFPPCQLCYIQRVFLYPQVFLLGWLLIRDTPVVRKITLGLSIFGAGVAIYHYYGQMFNAAALTCNVGADGASLCSQVPFVEFGYITIPMLSLTSFVLIITLLLIPKKQS